MAKFTEFTAATALTSTDVLALAKSGVSYQITAAEIFASPQPIGTTTPLAGAFTTLSATGISSLADITLTAANPEVLGADTDGITYFSAGATTILGASIRLYGDTHATKADDFEVYGSATLQLHYDDSTSTWDFQANKIVTTGDLTVAALTSTGINDNSTSLTMTIDASDRFLVGHTSSVADTVNQETKFQMHGTSPLDGAAQSMFRFQASADGPSYRLNKSRHGTIGSHTIVQDGDVLGEYYFGGSDGVAFIPAGLIRVTVDGTPGVNDMPGKISLWTTADGASSATERMSVDSSGNVGIGATSNGSRLYVTETVDALSYYDHFNTNTGSSAGVYQRIVTQNAAASGTIASGLLKYKAGELRILNGETGSTGNMTFYTAGAEAARIDSSGNVGIGTTSPDGTLHVHTATAGSVTANADADDFIVENSGNGGFSILVPDANNGNIYWSTPTAAVAALLRYNYDASLMTIGTNVAGDSLVFYTGASATALTIDSNQDFTFAGDIKLADNILERPVLKDYGETGVSASSTTTYTVDLTSGNVFDITLTGNCTFTFSNPPATGTGGSFTLILTQDGTGSRTATWPASVDWAGGTAPTLTTTATTGVDVLTFITVDAGTTWLGFLAGADMQ